MPDWVGPILALPGRKRPRSPPGPPPPRLVPPPLGPPPPPRPTQRPLEVAPPPRPSQRVGRVHREYHGPPTVTASSVTSAATLDVDVTAVAAGSGSCRSSSLPTIPGHRWLRDSVFPTVPDHLLSQAVDYAYRTELDAFHRSFLGPEQPEPDAVDAEEPALPGAYCKSAPSTRPEAMGCPEWILGRFQLNDAP